MLAGLSDGEAWALLGLGDPGQLGDGDVFDVSAAVLER